jgi:hypothetical protein
MIQHPNIDDLLSKMPEAQVKSLATATRQYLEDTMKAGMPEFEARVRALHPGMTDAEILAHYARITPAPPIG